MTISTMRSDKPSAETWSNGHVTLTVTPYVKVFHITDSEGNDYGHWTSVAAFKRHASEKGLLRLRLNPTPKSS